MREIVRAEPYRKDGGDFLFRSHCVVARNINPLRHNLLAVGEPIVVEDNRIGLLKAGEVEVMANLVKYRITAGTVAYIARGSVVELVSVSSDVELNGIVFDDDLLNEAMNGRMPQMFVGERLNHYKRGTAEEIAVVEGLLEVSWEVMRQPAYNRGTMQGVVKALVYFFDSIQERQEDGDVVRRSRERELFERFLTLVNGSDGRVRKLKDFAEMMCVTERYLGTAVMHASGTTAKTWIDRATVNAAKIALRHTDGQITQIADELGFPSASFFCKFFRRLVGCTPMDYRRK